MMAMRNYCAAFFFVVQQQAGHKVSSFSSSPFINLIRLSSSQGRRQHTGNWPTFVGASSSSTTSSNSKHMDNNPLLKSWSDQPFGMPPFEEIETKHYIPALEKGMQQHLNELIAIANNDEVVPTFENTIAAIDRAGSLLSRIMGVYSNACNSYLSSELQEIQTQMAPKLSRHATQCMFIDNLFNRIDIIYQKRNQLQLNSQQIRLVERLHLDFVRAGATLNSKDQKEYTDILAQLSTLETKFAQNVLLDEQSYELVLNQNDLDGCPSFLVDAMQQVATERGYNNNNDDIKYVLSLSRSLVEPFLTYSNRRDLRRQLFQDWTRRGQLCLQQDNNDNERDNTKIAIQILKLRQRQAKLHGYKSFAHYQCIDRMAQTPEKVMELLTRVWDKAKEAANRERMEMEQFIRDNNNENDSTIIIEPWDWRYYAEKVRQAKYNFDESLFKPYLSLESMNRAVMGVSNQLFGLSFIPRPDIPTPHPDVDAYEVRDKNNTIVALFLQDPFARPGKLSGAWMSEYRSQTKNYLLTGDDDSQQWDGIPIVVNTFNFVKGGGGEGKQSSCLLSWIDATTLFHEMGHGHHGILSDCDYVRLSSTSVLKDFVELPSQLMEHWLRTPSILKEYARHVETNESIPDELITRQALAAKFNQGFENVEYIACALVDMVLHTTTTAEHFDLNAFEKTQLQHWGMPQGIAMRHSLSHFLHLFSSSSYAAGYYVYLWAGILDADVFAAFQETGNVFDATVADKCQKYIYSAGNKEAPDQLFYKFRGRREPDPKFFLQNNGLIS